MTLVSIIVPCYNQGQFLNDALNSVFNQSHSNWECIIVNDGSSDSTEEIAMVWIKKDARFKLTTTLNGGLAMARNNGIKHANGAFVLPLDADDRISDDYIQIALKLMEKSDLVKLVYAKGYKFGVESGIWKLPTFSLLNLARSNMIHCSALFRRSDWERVGGYDTNMKYGLEDWEFWIAILKDGGEVKFIDRVCFYYRIRANSMVRSINYEERKYTEEYVAKKHIYFFLKNYSLLLESNSQASAILSSRKRIAIRFIKLIFSR